MAYKISDECIACGTCIDECPVGAISEGDIYVIDAETCTDCGACADICPTEAIHRIAFSGKGINGAGKTAPVSFYKHSVNRYFQPFRQTKTGLYGYYLPNNPPKNIFVTLKYTLEFGIL